jgi:hypothetical protein
MNKKNKVLVIWIGLMLAFCLKAAATTGQDFLLPILSRLQNQFKLNQDQILRIKQIMVLAREQMFRDRQMFKGHEVALIEAAKKRRDMTEEHIKSVFGPGDIQIQNEVKSVIHLNDQVIQLMEILVLDFKQGYQIAEINQKTEDQRKVDQKIHFKSAMTLINAAKSREDAADHQIQQILSEKQKTKYTRFKSKNPLDIEFFEFKEGLRLDEEQTLKLKQILKEHRTQLKKLSKKRNNEKLRFSGDRPGGMMGRGKGMPGGGPPAGMTPGGMGGRRGNKGPGQQVQEMGNLEEKKIKAIASLLKQEQFPLFKQILEIKQREREKKMKKRGGSAYFNKKG